MSKLCNGNFKNENMKAESLAKLTNLLRGGWIAQCLYIVAEHGIADLFIDGEAMSSEELSKITGTHEDSLKRVLRILSGVGIFYEDKDEKYRLTETGKLLHSNHTMSLRPLALWYNDAFTFNSMRALEGTVKYGKPSCQLAFKQTLFEYINDHPDHAEKFYSMLEQLTGIDASFLLDALEGYVSNITSIIDIGGGDGAFVGHILQRYSHLNGIVYDLPAAIANVSKHLKSISKSRWEMIEGNFFHDDIPSDSNLYIMKYILHDFNDEKSLIILKNLHKSMKKNNITGKLLVIEGIVEPNNPDITLFTDMMMLAIGGKERTENEFKTLFNNAGFKDPICTKVPKTKFFFIETTVM